VNFEKLAGVKHLVVSLREMYADVQIEMDNALKEQATRFDRDVYENLIFAFNDIGKVNEIPQKLQKEPFERISAFDGQVRLAGDKPSVASYRHLLQSVVDNRCAVLGVHQQVVACHHGVELFETVRRRIEEMVPQLWDEAERRVTQLVKRAPLEDITFDDFSEILNITSGFVEFGRKMVDFPGRQLSALTAEYFKQFDGSSIASIRENLESDKWVAIPPTPEFERSIMSIQLRGGENSDASLGMTSRNIQSAFPFKFGGTSPSCSHVLKTIHHYLSLIMSVPDLRTEVFNGIRHAVEFYAYSMWFVFSQMRR
jgi:hypothetical protein